MEIRQQNGERNEFKEFIKFLIGTRKSLFNIIA